MYLSLFCKGSKRLFKVCVWEGAGDRTETAIFWPPLLWPSTLCLSRSPGLLNRRPRGPLCLVICNILSATSLRPNSIGGPRAHSAWCCLPYHTSSTSVSNSTATHQGPQGSFGLMWLYLPHLVYLRLQLYCNSSRAPRLLRPDVALPTTTRLSPSPTLTGTATHQGPKAPSAWCGFTYRISSISVSNSNWNLTCVLTKLYNSSTPTQSPTRSLKSHVWSSSSGNNCHAVHRSLSSGASVYECTMGFFFTSSHFIGQFQPTQFPLITAIRMCHLLPVYHLGMAFLAGSKVKIQQYIVGQTRFSSLGSGNQFRRKTQNSNLLNSAKKLTLCYILPVRSGL